MRERAGLILKIACCGLAALVLLQLGSVVVRLTRASVTIPQLPTLSDDQSAKGTNAPAARTNTASAAASVAKGTNKSPVASATNSVSGSTNFAGTNESPGSALVRSETNSAPGAEPVKPGSMKAEMNLPSHPRSELAQGTVTMSVPSASTEKSSNLVRVLAGTNEQLLAAMASTNATARRPTNAASARDLAMAGAIARPGPAGKASDLPPPIKARISRIVESEILGQVIRPMPMALIGIAGNAAIIRTPSGQTGLVKEGDELGGIKLLQIGVNRVLIEEQGQKKELTIFSGFGSESLLAKPKETPDEPTHK
jgi:hypothetical protein